MIIRLFKTDSKEFSKNTINMDLCKAKEEIIQEYSFNFVLDKINVDLFFVAKKQGKYGIFYKENNEINFLIVENSFFDFNLFFEVKKESNDVFWIEKHKTFLKDDDYFLDNSASLQRILNKKNKLTSDPIGIVFFNKVYNMFNFKSYFEKDLNIFLNKKKMHDLL